MITINISSDLDVVTRYKELIASSLDGDSVYIRTKETLQDLFESGNITDVDKATVISQVMGALNTSVVSAAMQTALQWETQQKTIELQKLEMQYKLELLAQQATQIEYQIAESLADRQLKQAQLRRTFGVATVDTEGNVTSLTNVGTSYAQEQNTIQDTANKLALNTQIGSQTEEVQARTHKLVADTYVNHGLFTGYTVTDNGIASATKVNTGYTTLSDLNKQVAKEQAKGYTYNAWASAASAGASMLGTIAAAEVPEISATTYAELANIWKTPTTKLGNLAEPDIIT